MNAVLSAPPPTRERYRIRFAKTGLLRWIGHRDLQRLWERLLRRAELPLSLSQGFHPKPRISFPSALALGVEGCDEVIEFELTVSISPESLRQRLVDDGQPGLEIGDVRRVARAAADGTPDPSFPNLAKARIHCGQYEITIPESFTSQVRSREEIGSAIEAAKRLGTVKFTRNGREVSTEIATHLPLLELRDQTLCLTIVEAEGATLKPSDVLAAIGLEGLIEHGGVPRRTHVILVDERSDHAHAHALRGNLPVAMPTAETTHPTNTSFKERS